jgi:hypothetical protein
MKLAIKLSRTCKTRSVPEEGAKGEAQMLINRTPLNTLIDTKLFSVRYPTDKHPLVEGPDAVTGLLQRTYTWVPSTSAAFASSLISGSGYGGYDDHDENGVHSQETSKMRRRGESKAQGEEGKGEKDRGFNAITINNPIERDTNIPIADAFK